MEKASTIELASTVRYERINAKLAEQGVIGLPGGLSLHSIAMSGDPDFLIATAEVKGPYSGSVIAKCKPTYSNDTRKFALEGLNIELGEDNFLAKLAGKFVNNLFAEKADSKLEEVVNEKFTAMLQDILGHLRNIELPEGATLRFDTQNFNLYNLRTDAEGLHFIAELTGFASLEY